MAQPTNVELLQQMMQMLQRQQELIETLALSQGAGGRKVDGLKMPTYSERSEESVRLFYAQVKNISLRVVRGGQVRVWHPKYLLYWEAYCADQPRSSSYFAMWKYTRWINFFLLWKRSLFPRIFNNVCEMNCIVSNKTTAKV